MRPSGLFPPNDPLTGQTEPTELPVSVIECEGKCRRGLGRAAADFRKLEFDAVRKIDPDTMLFAVDRAPDRLPLRCEKFWNRCFGSASLDVDVEVDPPEQRLVHDARHRA